MSDVKGRATSLESIRGDAVVATNVRRNFNGRDVLRDVNLTIEGDEFVALLGRSGSGKSTLLRILGGLDADYEGDVLVPERRAVVFQEARLVPWLRVLANVVLGLSPRRVGRTALRERGRDALREVELELLFLRQHARCRLRRSRWHSGSRGRTHRTRDATQIQLDGGL